MRLSVWAHYYNLAGAPNPLGPASAECLTLDPRLGAIRDTFLANVRAVLSTASIPVNLVSSAISTADHREKHAFEHLIEFLKGKGLATDTPENKAKREERLSSFPTDEEADRMALVIGRILVSFAHNDPTDCVRELLRQCSVLLWGSFEVCAKDSVAALLNARPSLTILLQNDPRTKRVIDAKSIGLQVLEEYGFDLSSRMGEWYTRSAPTWTLQTVRDTFSVLCPDSKALHEALGSEDLWILGMRRHLIVHSAGTVDEQYKRLTGDALPIGSKVEVQPLRFRTYSELVVNAAALLLKATSDCRASAEPPP